MTAERKVSFVPYGTNNPGYAPLWGLSFIGTTPSPHQPRDNYIYLLTTGKGPDSGEVHRKWKHYLPTGAVEAYNFRSYASWLASHSSIPSTDIPMILEDLEKIKGGHIPIKKLTDAGQFPIQKGFSRDIADFLIPRVASIAALCTPPDFTRPLEDINELAGLRI